MTDMVQIKPIRTCLPYLINVLSARKIISFTHAKNSRTYLPILVSTRPNALICVQIVFVMDMLHRSVDLFTRVDFVKKDIIPYFTKPKRGNKVHFTPKNILHNLKPI